MSGHRIESLEALASVRINAVLVDRIGVAWQVIQLGADWSAHKSGRDTRRNGFVQAGNQVNFEADQLASVLPMRVVDDGCAEPSVAPLVPRTVSA